MSVSRYDSGSFGAVEVTPSGGIRVPAYLTRIGVFTYREEGGAERREFRPPEEVFAETSLSSLRNATVTDLHPTKPVDASNWKELSIGHVGEDVQADGSHVSASLVVQDARAIALIESKARKELSCGYRCTLEMVSGEYQGEKYDAIQREIRYNHVALGPEGWGRAGSTVALRLDSGDAIQVNDSLEETPPMKIRIDGKDYDLSVPTEKAAAEAALAALQADRDTAKGRADGLTAQVQSLTTDLAAAKDPKAIAAKVKVRADLLVTARKVAEMKGLKFDEAAAEANSDLEMMGSMIKVMHPSFDPTGKSEDFVRGMFSAFVTVAATAAEQSATSKATETPPADAGAGTPPPAAPAAKTDGQPSGIFQARATADGQTTQETPRVDASEARKRNDKASREAWMSPLAMSKNTAPAK